jgi:hypothetical protein
MPLFMDQHDTRGATSEDLAKAHENDLAVQAQFNVRFLTYWLDYPRGVANCLVEAPSPETVNEVHGVAHGLLANRVIPVSASEVSAILGRLSDPDDGVLESATRTFVFTDMVGSTALMDTLGDEAAFKVIRDHNHRVRDLVGRHRGREVKQTGDGFMLAFTFPADALAFAQDLQRALADEIVAVRIGVNTGTPSPTAATSLGWRSPSPPGCVSSPRPGRYWRPQTWSPAAARRRLASARSDRCGSKAGPRPSPSTASSSPS